MSGETYITESGTGVYYQVRGVRVLDQSFGQVLFAIGLITPVPNVHLIQAKQLVSVPENGGVSCKGTLAKREGRYFVESSAVLGCGSIELIESDPQKLDPQVGQETTLMVRSCTVTKGGRMVKTDLDLGFTCSSPSP